MMNRIGFHYFPDTFHYRQIDLETWLPRLETMKARWLVIMAPADRAIPEPFIRGLLNAKIEPILQFDLYPDRLPTARSLSLLFKVYAKWGVRYISLFDKPNLQSSWEVTNWTRIDLVERFLDIYLPLAEKCLSAGITPIFPPLEPGGDYWDTAFLRASLLGIKRRGAKPLLDKMVIGASVQIKDKNLNWGAGGPERWPGIRPYSLAEGKEDHRGFRIFDWYNTLVQSVINKPLPVFLFDISPSFKHDPDYTVHSEINFKAAQLLQGCEIDGFDPVPDNIIGSAFWLLSAHKKSPYQKQAWFKSNGETLPIVRRMEEWITEDQTEKERLSKLTRQIEHYLLLPTYEGEILDIHLDLIRPYLKKYRPTIGFSLEEAERAKRVTILGESTSYPEGKISHLRNIGCIVRQLDENGIDVASL